MLHKSEDSPAYSPSRRRRQAPSQLWTSGHKSLHRLNMRGLDLLYCCITPLGGMCYLMCSSALSSFSPRVVWKLSPAAEPALFFITSFSCSSHLPAPVCQHHPSTSLQHCCADHHWSTEQCSRLHSQTHPWPLKRNRLLWHLYILSLSLVSVLRPHWFDVDVQSQIFISCRLFLHSQTLFLSNSRGVIQEAADGAAQSWIFGLNVTPHVSALLRLTQRKTNWAVTKQRLQIQDTMALR